MNTSNLSQTAPLAAVPSLLPFRSWASALLHRAGTFLMRAFHPAGSAFSASLDAFPPLPGTPVHFSGKGIYTPLQDWDGYR